MKKGSSKIRQYRPGYTWNIGGRVKELRIRCIARKFLFIWIRKTFGRITLSKARLAYKTRLVHRCWKVWNGIWWEARKEWGLGIRADLHNRYRLWNLVMAAWKVYTAERRHKSARNQLALDSYGKRILTVYVSVWRARYLYVVGVSAKAETLRKTGDTSLLRETWAVWTDQLTMVKQQQQQAKLADSTWRHHVYSWVWARWCERLTGRRLERQMEVTAQRHDRRRVLHAALQALVDYTHMRRLKRQHSNTAWSHYGLSLLRSHLLLWQRRHRAMHDRDALSDHINTLADRATCRRALLRWRQALRERRDLAALLQRAEDHYVARQRARCISLLRWNVQRIRHNADLAIKADAFHHHQVVLQAWRQWCAAIEAAQELKQAPHSQRAIQHRATCQLRATFTQWSAYCRYRSHRQSQYIFAETYRNSVLLPKLFEAWRNYKATRQYEVYQKHEAQNHWRQRVLGSCFQLWRERHEQSTDARLLERMAILHCDQRLTAAALAVWRHRTAALLTAAAHWEAACSHYERHLVTFTFKAWRRATLAVKAELACEVKATQHRRSHQLHNAWQCWQQYVNKRRVKHTAERLATNHFARTSQVTAWSHWRLYHSLWVKVKRATALRTAQQNHDRLTHAMDVWRSHVLQVKQQRNDWHTAVTHCTDQLLYKVFTVWHRYSVQHASRKANTLDAVVCGRQALDKGKLARLFAVWRQLRDDAIVQRLKMERASQHHHRHLLDAAWSSWRHYVNLSIRKRLLAMQAERIVVNRRLRVTWTVWQCRLEQARHYQQLTDKALWHWSVLLQCKVFAMWRVYTSGQRHKKRQVAEAVLWRKDRLVRSAAAHWLAVSCDLQQQRQLHSAKQGLQSYYREQLVARKAVSHWRHLVARQRCRRDASARETRATVPLTTSAAHLYTSPVLVSSAKPLVTSPRVPRQAPVSAAAAPTVYSRPLSPVLHKRTLPRYPDFLAQSLVTFTPAPVETLTSDLPAQSSDAPARVNGHAAAATQTLMPETGREGEGHENGVTDDTGYKLLPPEVFMAPVRRHDDTPAGDSVTLPPAGQGQGQLEELMNMRAVLEHYQQVKVRCRHLETVYGRLCQQEAAGDGASMDLVSTQHLTTAVAAEIAELKAELRQRRPVIESLVTHLQSLAPA